MSGELIYTLQTPKDIVTREKGGADSLPGFACGDTVDVVLLKKKMQMRIWVSLIIRVI